MSAIILDTETTDADAPQVIELAIMGPLDSPLSDGAVQCFNFKPTKPISLGALATHHIIAADLETYPVFESQPLPAGTEYVIGHNIDFDWKAIGEPAVKRICTLALARSVWPKIDSHRLAALIYHLYPHALARDLVKNARNAAADVDLCKRVLYALWDAVGRPDTWEKLWAISEEARVPKVMPFGKYGPKDGKPGMSIEEMRRLDPGYVSWLLNNADQVKNDPYWLKALKPQRRA